VNGEKVTFPKPGCRIDRNTKKGMLVMNTEKKLSCEDLQAQVKHEPENRGRLDDSIKPSDNMRSIQDVNSEVMAVLGPWTGSRLGALIGSRSKNKIGTKKL